MKNLRFLLAVAVIAIAAPLALSAQAVKAGSKITVSPPALQNGAAADAWVPLFVQGQLTTDFQNYSGLTVIDRQAAAQLMGEQELTELNAYANGDESSSIQYASLIDADYTVVVQLLKKGTTYALTCSIQDVKKATPLGKAYANANVSEAALNDGSAIHTACYELLRGLGIAESQLAGLNQQIAQQTAVQQAEVVAQQSIARGIVAEQQGTNIEALMYYIQAHKNDRNSGEASSRMANMTTVVASGNFGANAKNLIRLRKQWDALLEETASFIASNWPKVELRYFCDIEALELTEADYENGTMSFSVSTPYVWIDTIALQENAIIANELMETMRKIPESKDWGSKINGFPWTYADIGGKSTYSFSVTLQDASRKQLAKQDISFEVDYAQSFSYPKVSVRRNMPKAEKERSLLLFNGISVGDADTDALYITVANDREIVPVIPVAEGTLGFARALTVLETKAHDGTVKIGGYINSRDGYAIAYSALNSTIQKGGKYVSLDLSELYEVLYTSRSSWFEDNEWLTGIVLPNNLKKISKNAFKNCTALRSVVIPYGATEIGTSAFEGCTSLTSVTIPDTMETIGDNRGRRTFYNCTSLTTITLPASVRFIEQTAFFNCTALKEIRYRGSKEQWDAIRMGDASIVDSKEMHHYENRLFLPTSPRFVFDYAGK